MLHKLHFLNTASLFDFFQPVIGVGVVQLAYWDSTWHVSYFGLIHLKLIQEKLIARISHHTSAVRLENLHMFFIKKAITI